MNRLKYVLPMLAAGVAAVLLAALPARAASPNVFVSVEPIPQTVTYSRPGANPPLVTNAAYAVTVRNDSINVINSVSFTADASVLRAGEVVTFRESIGFDCTTPAPGSTSVTCSFGKLRGGGDGRSFVLVFNAPAEATGSGPDAINLRWTATYGEGPSDSAGAAHMDTQNGVAVTALGTPTDTEVRGYIGRAGGRLFTGIDSIPTSDDRWTTSVTIPSFARAEVIETTDLESCSSFYNVCVKSTLRIPGSFDSLYITLRRDSSTLQKSPKPNIANAVINYQNEVLQPDGSYLVDPLKTPIVSCDILPGRMPNAANKRCIDYRLEYTGTYVRKNKLPAALEGDWEFGIKALENGVCSW